MSEVRRYTFKLQPSAAQAEALEYQRRRHCDLYNACLQQRIEAYQRQGVSLTEYDQSRELKFLRRECQEFAGISTTSLALTIRRVDRAFQAFFRRAKAGAGRQAGFPRFKSGRDYPGFSFRCGKKPGGKPAWSGWRIDLNAPKPGDHRRRPRNGRLYVKCVPGLIKMRGRLPVAPDRIVMGDLLWRQERWWLSLVVEQPARRCKGHGHATIKLDLIDSFAAVEAAEDGPCGSGPEADLSSADGRTTPMLQGVASQSDAATPENGGGRRGVGEPPDREPDAATPENGGGRRGFAGDHSMGSYAATPENGGGRRSRLTASYAEFDAATPENGGGRRPVRRGAGFPYDAATPENVGGRRPTDWVGIAPPDAATPGNVDRCRDLQRAMARCKKWSNRYRRLRARKFKIEARMARKRRENLHRWTTEITAHYASVILHTPKLTEITKSGRGDAYRWGAMVKDKARLNRHILDFAAGEARAQLEYKFAESGGEFQAIEVPDHPTAVGNLLVDAGKTIRKLRRKAS